MKKLLVICCVAVAVPTATADTRPAHVEGVVKIRNQAPAFHGRVVAENGSCNGPRPVKLYERERTGDRVLLGVTTASLNGRWHVPVDPRRFGLYFAAAPKTKRIDGGVEFVCERAVSRLLVVD
jgi:hypothetical protein